jgi:hypothetical protein
MTAIVDREPELRRVRRQVFRFDRVFSLLSAFVVLAGAVVLWLSAMWLASRVWPAHSPARSVEMVDVRFGDEEGMIGDDPELGENALPSTDEMPLRDSSLEFEDADVVQVLSSVLDALSEEQVDLSDPSQRSGEEGSGRTGGPGGEGLEGTGAGRGGVPNHARWDVQYPSQSVQEYAALLDALGIELGVVRKGRPVLYVSQLSRGRPVVRSSAEKDDRLTFRWQDAQRRAADLNLLRQKGVNVEGAFVVQFFPASLEAALLDVERKHANRPIQEIKKTRFGVQGREGRYEFHVVEQTYAR